MSLELIRVRDPKAGAIVGDPLLDARGPGRRPGSVGEVVGHSSILVPGEQDVSQRDVEKRGSHGQEDARYLDHFGAAPDCSSDGLYELKEGWTIGADCVDNTGLPASPGGHREFREIIHMDRPDAVVATSTHREDREVSEQPGDVVDEHAVGAEQEAGRSTA